MKYLYVLTVTSVFFVLCFSDSYGQNTWTNGNATGIWNDAGNWSGGIPGAADDVVFDGTSTANCAIDINANVNSISINSGYTGTITQNAGITIDVANIFSQADGTFTGGDSYIDVNDTVLFSGGTFTSTTNELRCGSGFEVTAAMTFNHNNGTLLFDGTLDNRRFDVNSTLTLHNLTMSKGNNDGVEIGSNDVVTVNNALTLTEGDFLSDDINNPGKIRLGSGATSVSIAAAYDGGTAILLIEHAMTIGIPANQNMNGLEINNASATVNLSADVDIEGDIIITNGTLNDQGNSFEIERDFTIGASGTFTSTGTPIFGQGNNTTLDVPTNYTFNNLTFNKTNNNRAVSILAGDTITVSGTLTLTNGEIDNGVIIPQSTVTHNSTFDGGTGILYMNAAATTTLSTGSMLGIHLDNAGAVVDCPTSGTLTFEGALTLDNGTFNGHGSTGTGSATIDINNATTINGGTFNFSTGTTTYNANLTYTAGTVNHQNGTLEFDLSADRALALTSSISLYNVEIAGNNNNRDLIISNSELIVQNDLTLTNGIINTGNIEVDGVVNLATTFDGGASSGTITFSSSNTSTADFTAGGNTPGIIVESGATTTINGPTLGNTLTIEGILDMSAGSFVSSDGAVTINSTMNLAGNAAFTAPSTGTLRVDGAYTQTSGTPTFTGAAGAMDFNSTYALSTGSFTSGASNFDLTGTFTLSGTGSFTATTSGTLSLGDTYTQTDAGSAFIGSSGDIDLNDPLSVTDGSFTSASGNFNFSGATWTMNAAASAAFTHNSGTVIFDRAGIVDIALGAATAFNNVTVAITSGNDDLNISGSEMTIATTGTLALNDGEINTGTIEVAGDITNATTFDGGTGLIHITGGAVRTISLTATAEMPSIQINDANATINLPDGGSNVLEIEGTLDIDAGILNVRADSFYVDGAVNQSGGTFTQTTGGIRVDESYVHSAGTFTGGAGELDFNSTFAQSGGAFTAGSGNITLAGTFTLSSTGSFTSTSSGTFTFGSTYTQTDAGSSFNGSSGDIDLNDTFSVTDGTFTAPSGSFSFSGTNWTMNAAASAAFSGNGGTVIYDRNGNVDVSLGAATTFNSVTVALTSGNDNLTISASEMVVGSAGTLALNDGEILTGTIEVAGDITNTTSFDGGTGLIHITGGGVRTISLTSTAEMPSLQINDANVTVDMPNVGGNRITVEGNLDIDAGTINNRADSLYVTGTLDQSGGTFTQTSGGIRIDGTYSQSGGIFTGGSGFLDYNSTFDLSGTADFTSTSATITITSNVTITGGSYTGGDDIIDWNGTFSQSGGTFDAGAGDIDLTGTFTLSGTGSFTSNSSGTFTLGSTYTQTDATSAFIGAAGDMDLNNTYSVTDGAFTAPSGTFNFSGTNWTMNAAASAAFSGNGGTVIYDRNGNIDVSLGAATTFNNVTVALTSGNDNLTISASEMLIGSAGTLALNDGEILTGTVQVAGDITNTTSFDGGTGLIHITGGGVRTINLTSTAEMPEMRINDANVTLNYPNTGGNVLTIEGDLDIDAGTVNVLADQLAVSGLFDQSGGTFTQTTGEIQVAGTYTQSNGTFTGGAGILDYNSSFSQSGGTFSAGSGNIDIANTFSLSGSADFTSTTSGTIAVVSNVFITGGSYTGGGDIIDFNGTFTQTAGTFDAGAGNGDLTGSFTLSGTGSFTANSSGTFTFGDTYIQTDATSAFIGSSGDLDLADDLTVTDGAFTSSSGTFNFSGGTWTMNAAASVAFAHNSGTVEFDRANDITVNLGDNATFNNVTVNLTNGGGGNDDLNITGSDIIVTGTGTLALNDGEVLSGTIQVQGDITNTTSFDGGTSGLIHVTGGAVRTISLTATAEMPPMRINDANVTIDLPNGGGNTLTIEGNLDIDAGTLNARADKLDVDGTLDQSGGTFTQTTGEIEVAGTYTQSNGTFTGGAGELDYNSTFTQSGGTFTGGSGDINLTGDLTLSGTADFTSSTAGTFTLGDDILVFGGSFTGGGDVIDLNDDIQQSGGTIDLGPGDVTVGDVITLTSTADFTANSSGTLSIADEFTQTGGSTVFNGSSGDIDLNANLTVTDGTFTSTSGNFNFSGGTWTMNAAAVGNFAHNSGTIIADRTDNDQTFSLGADITVNDITVNLTSANTGRDDFILSGADMIVTGSLLMIDGQINRAAAEEMEIQGDMDATGGVFSGGSAVLHVTNGAVRTISFTEGTNTIPPLRVNDANATVQFPDEDGETFTIDGDIDLDVGILSARRSDFLCEGAFTQDGGTFNGASDEFTIQGNFSANGGTFNSTSRTYTFQGGTFHVDALGTFNHSSGTVLFNRTTDITVDLDNATTFNNVIVNQTGNNNNDDLVINDQDMITIGLLTLTDGEILTGTVEVQGTISTAGGLFSGGTTGLLNVTNGGVRSFTLDACNIPNLTVNDANVTITFPASGTLTIENDFLLTVGTVNGGDGDIDIDDDYDQNGGTFNAGTGTIIVSDNFTQTAGSFVGNGNIDISDNFTINSTASFTAPSDTLFVEDTYDHNSPATFDDNNGTVQFDGGNNQTVNYDGGDLVFHNVIINKTNTAREVRPDSDLDINGNLTITAGRLELRQGNAATLRDINLAGNYRNDFGTNGLLERESNFTFDGNGDQTIDADGGETFYNMIINKVGGEVILNDSITASNLLTMTAGNIRCDGNDVLLDSYSNLSGGGAASYFYTLNGGTFNVGYGAIDVSSRTIHLGDASNYTPFIFQLSSATLTSARMQFSVTASGHPNRDMATDYINRYWSYTPTGITGSISYDMSYTYLDADITGDESNLVGAKFSGGDWTEGGTVVAGTNTVTWIGETEFSDATAMDNVASPLPIELGDFEAQLVDGKVELWWETLSEINNDYFTIEKSQDGKIFELVDHVKGSGNSVNKRTYSTTDYKPYPGISYYRLIQTDFDGTVDDNFPIQVIKNFNQSLKIYPNPTVNRILYIDLDPLQLENEYLNLRFVDNHGKIVFSQDIRVNQEYSKLIKLDIPESIPAGIYTLVGNSSNRTFSELIIIQ